MNLQEIENLLKHNEIEESINNLIKISECYSQGISNSAKSLKPNFLEIDKDRLVGINVSDRIIRLRQCILGLITKMRTYSDPNGNFQTISHETLVMEGSFPFIDRSNFRELIHKKILENKGSLIFVEGEPKSGMSYLEKYLIHLKEVNNIFKIISINIPLALESPDPGYGMRLARYMAEYLDLEVDFKDSGPEHFKYTRFLNRLREKCSCCNEIPIFFLHDFHKLSITPNDLLDFIYNLAQSIMTIFPKTLIIIAGLKCELIPNWQSELRLYYQIFQLENIDEQSIKECLASIYKRYKDKIIELGNQNLTEEDYVQGLIQKLNKEYPNNMDVTFVGSMLANQLYKLKNN